MGEPVWIFCKILPFGPHAMRNPSVIRGIFVPSIEDENRILISLLIIRFKLTSREASLSSQHAHSNYLEICQIRFPKRV
jgi:hypothetical protein